MKEILRGIFAADSIEFSQELWMESLTLIAANEA
jgi:hypothetical protein